MLTDGGTAHVRPIRPTTPTRSWRCTPASRRRRSTSASSRPGRCSPSREVERFTQVDYDDRMALVAELGDEMVAVARYDRNPGGDGTEAEVAFTVDDAQQGRGLGTILLEHLAVIARAHGITRFVADTLPQNRRMLDVFHARRLRGRGHVRRRRRARRVPHRARPRRRTPAMHDRERHRRRPDRCSGCCGPRSIAVIGAGRNGGTIGHEVFRNLLDGDFAGPVYPVQPDGRPRRRACARTRRVLDVPDDVDLAVDRRARRGTCSRWSSSARRSGCGASS